MDRRLVAGVVVGGAVALDQVTKELALHHLSDGDTVPLVPTVELDLAFNSGFSFGLGAGNGPLIGFLVIAISVLLVWYMGREHRTSRIVALSTILGGALGNLGDRLFRAGDGFLSGHVVDFIDVEWYAVFNVADTFVVCGGIALVLLEMRSHAGGTDPGRAAGHADGALATEDPEAANAEAPRSSDPATTRPEG